MAVVGAGDAERRLGGLVSLVVPNPLGYFVWRFSVIASLAGSVTSAANNSNRRSARSRQGVCRIAVGRPVGFNAVTV